MVDLTRRFDRVAIVGFCQPDRDWVPYDDPELEVWGLNRGMIFMPVAHRWFEMHGPAIHEWQQRRPGNHLAFLKAFPGPIYMHQARPDLIPNAVDYPIREVTEDLWPGLTRFDATHDIEAGTAAPYLSSTVAQEIALAIHLGYREIGLYGIDLNTTSEYAWQKPGVEHMLGLAMGRGIKVRLPAKCPLLQGEVYGRAYLSPKGEILSPDQWMERISSLQRQKEQIEQQIQATAGGRKELQWVIDQMVPGIDHEILDQRRQQFEKAIQQLQAQGHQIVGALQETIYWAHQTPAGQDPHEALGQLVASMEDPKGESNAEAVIAALAETELEHHDDEGPPNGSVAAALIDVASGGPVGMQEALSPAKGRRGRGALVAV